MNSAMGATCWVEIYVTADLAKTISECAFYLNIAYFAASQIYVCIYYV